MNIRPDILNDFNEFKSVRGLAQCAAFGVKLLREDSELPSYGSTGAAGMDLYAELSELETIELSNGNQGISIGAGERRLIPCGIAVELSPMVYGRIAPRSGLAYKHGLDVLAGVIDCDYRGEIGAVILNTSDKDYFVQQGERIAQMIITPYIACMPVQIDTFASETDRGADGFGSTGES